MNKSLPIVITILATTTALAVTSTHTKAAVRTSPVSLRGTWYHYFSGQWAAPDKPFVEKITITKHSMTSSYRGTHYRLKGKHFVVSAVKKPVQLKGHAKKMMTRYMLGDFGDLPMEISTHLTVAGKTRHVMLQNDQQNHMMIYTKFVPHKNYVIQAKW
ncbi:MAG: hypothetical protein ABF908_05630 [Lentilactobacillus diolivorans]